MESLKLDADKLVQLRTNTKLHLLQNPNYFGTVKDKVLLEQYQPVQVLGNYQTYYEELGCIDYKPETRTLGAVVIVKQPTGYISDACGGGSREYVRFFVDYDNNGTWVDEGLAEFGVYNHHFPDDLCYYAQITLDPNKANCCQEKAVLPNVRAILSWNTAPTIGGAGFHPTWGDVKEARIQIAPVNKIWCYIKHQLTTITSIKFDPKVFATGFDKLYLPELEENSTAFKPVQKATLSPVELKRIYGKEVAESRIAQSSISHYLLATNTATTKIETILPGFNIAELVEFHLFPKFNTEYEELNCVSLNRDLDTLHAAVHIKRPTGYLGGLCTTGSKEYVAFYMDFGSGWEYMGTGNTPVHDIPENVPAVGGIWYDVPLNINLDKHRKQWCEVGKARLKGILSWNTPPPPNHPNYIAPYGDWEECNVEVKPLPKDVHPGNVQPFLEMVGGMVVTDINQASGTATTTLGSASLGNAFESPFYGEIQLKGTILNAAPGMKYRFRITEPGVAMYNLLQTQSVQTSTGSSINPPTAVVPDGDGWLDFLGVGGLTIVENLVGRYYTPAKNGMYSVTIEAKDVASTIYPGNTVQFLVDKDAPDVSIHITSGTGDCGDFTSGIDISGTYSMTDAHAGSLSISVTPALGATVNMDGFGVSSLYYGGTPTPSHALPNTGKSGNFVISTVDVPKCGYNVRIEAADRTILNSIQVGNSNTDIKGFCLREAGV